MKVFSSCCISAVVLLLIIQTSAHDFPQQASLGETSGPNDRRWKEGPFNRRWRRELPSTPAAIAADDGDLDSDDNCSSINDYEPSYNSSCEFVEEQCQDKHELFNYLQFAVCDLGKVREECSLAIAMCMHV